MIRRPGVVTFIGVIMIIQSTLTLIAGIVLIALSGESRLFDKTGVDESGMVISGVVSLIIGAIVLLVALALLKGSKASRILVTLAQIVVAAGAVWSMFAHHDGAFLFQGTITIAIAVFVLWALFNERSEEYFDSL